MIIVDGRPPREVLVDGGTRRKITYSDGTVVYFPVRAPGEPRPAVEPYDPQEYLHGVPPGFDR